MGEEEDGKFEGGREGNLIPNNAADLPAPEAATKKEPSAEILAASHTIYDLANSYEHAGLNRPEEDDRFIQELDLLGLPDEELIEALEVAFQRARDEADDAEAMQMDPFLEEENMVQTADTMRDHQERREDTNVGLMLLISIAQGAIEARRHEREMTEIRRMIDEATKEPSSSEAPDDDADEEPH